MNYHDCPKEWQGSLGPKVALHDQVLSRFVRGSGEVWDRFRKSNAVLKITTSDPISERRVKDSPPMA
jgi:hypothetical protein